MNASILILMFILSTWTTSGLQTNHTDVMRPKREPPLYSHYSIKQSYGAPFRRKPKPIYGPPIRPVYGPPSKPKPVYGPPPKLIYGPPRPSYGPPKPVYGPPKPIYGPPIHFGAQVSNFGPPSYSEHSHGPPRHSFESQKTSYSHGVAEIYSQPYDIPQQLHSYPLTYDTSSASYGTPGALNSYGVPATQNEAPLSYGQFSSFVHHRNEEIVPGETLFADQYTADESSDYVKFDERPGQVSAPDPTGSHGTKVPNHNYDGPGVQDDYLETFVAGRKKQLEKLSNFYNVKTFDSYSNGFEPEKLQSYDLYAAKNNAAETHAAPRGTYRPSYH